MQETFGADEGTRSESPFMSPGELYDREDEPEFHKPKKPVIKLPKKLKAKVSPVRRRCCCGSCDIDSIKDSTVFFSSFYYSRLKTCIGLIRQELRQVTICQKLLK